MSRREEIRMPIYLAPLHVDFVIKEISGDDKLRTHLQNLGFMEGEHIMLVNKVSENVIVKIKGVSVAISKELAKRIMV